MLTLVFTRHAQVRMFEREITTSDVRDIVEQHTVVADHSNRAGNPSREIMGFTRRGRRLMAVIVEGAEAGQVIVITAYWPDPTKWNADFTERIDR